MLQRFAQIGVARAARSVGAVKKVDGNDLGWASGEAGEVGVRWAQPAERSGGG